MIAEVNPPCSNPGCPFSSWLKQNSIGAACDDKEKKHLCHKGFAAKVHSRHETPGIWILRLGKVLDASILYTLFPEKKKKKKKKTIAWVCQYASKKDQLVQMSCNTNTSLALYHLWWVQRYFTIHFASSAMVDLVFLSQWQWILSTLSSYRADHNPPTVLDLPGTCARLPNELLVFASDGLTHPTPKA